MACFRRLLIYYFKFYTYIHTSIEIIRFGLMFISAAPFTDTVASLYSKGPTSATTVSLNDDFCRHSKYNVVSGAINKSLAFLDSVLRAFHKAPPAR